MKFVHYFQFSYSDYNNKIWEFILYIIGSMYDLSNNAHGSRTKRYPHLWFPHDLGWWLIPLPSKLI